MPLFVYGPAIESPELVSWLARQEKIEVRLPVIVKLTDSKLGVENGMVGSIPGIRLQDAALGISLLDRVRQACPKKDPCTMWLDGYWHAPKELAVTRAGAVIGADEAKRPMYARAAVDERESNAAVFALIEKLGADLPLQEKRDASEALKTLGKEAIPLLIASLADARPYERRDFANRMNLPLGAHVEPQMGTVTAGMRCEDLLYAIITPAVASKHAGNFKVFSEQILSVKDWSVFWAARRDKSLADVHAELAPLVDTYWREHGTTQIVR